MGGAGSGIFFGGELDRWNRFDLLQKIRRWAQRALGRKRYPVGVAQERLGAPTASGQRMKNCARLIFPRAIKCAVTVTTRKLRRRRTPAPVIRRRSDDNGTRPEKRRMKRKQSVLLQSQNDSLGGPVLTRPTADRRRSSVRFSGPDGAKQAGRPKRQWADFLFE